MENSEPTMNPDSAPTQSASMESAGPEAGQFDMPTIEKPKVSKKHQIKCALAGIFWGIVALVAFSASGEVDGAIVIGLVLLAYAAWLFSGAITGGRRLVIFFFPGL